MNYKMLLFVALITFFIHISGIAQTGMHIPELSTVDTSVLAFMKKWNLQGGSVTLMKDGRLVYARGFGNADSISTVQPSHLFRIASLSKPITAMAIMNLVQEEALGLDDTVFGENGILNTPAYQYMADPAIKSITVRHLLQHTAGWDRNISLEGDPMLNAVGIAKAMSAPSPADQETIIRYILTKKLDFYPGTRYAYSNIGYNILGRVIEKITGLPYEQYVKKAILHPLGITSMQLGRTLPDHRQLEEVMYYEVENKSFVKSVFENGKQVSHPYGGFNLEAMDAHGGWIASATALARLLAASDGFASKPDFLREDIIQTMTITSVQSPNYGLGWFVRPSGNWWHTGSLQGSSAMMARLNNGISWVLLFNGNPMTPAYFSQLDKLMWKALSNITEWPHHDLFIIPENTKGLSMNVE